MTIGSVVKTSVGFVMDLGRCTVWMFDLSWIL